MLAAYRSVLRARLSKQQPVWFVGEIDSLSGSTDLNKFADFLRGTCRFEEVEPAPMSIYRLSAKE